MILSKRQRPAPTDAERLRQWATANETVARAQRKLIRRLDRRTAKLQRKLAPSDRPS